MRILYDILCQIISVRLQLVKVQISYVFVNIFKIDIYIFIYDMVCVDDYMNLIGVVDKSVCHIFQKY